MNLRETSRGLDFESPLSAGLSCLSICLPKTTGYKMSQCLVKIVKGTWSTLKMTSLLESRWSRCHLRGALIYSLYHTNKGIWLYNCIFFFVFVCFQPKLKSYHAKSVETSHQASTMESSHVKAVRSVKDMSFLLCIC